MVIQIDMYEVDMESSLGGGNYGEVFKAHHRETKAAVAAKRILTTKIKNQKYITGEIAALKAASGHPNIVSLLHHEQREDILWLIMEYCEAGNIHEYLTAHTVTDQQAAVITQDCVEAVHHLHNLQPRGIMHRDLKPENLLVTVIDGQPRIKVCDFGVSVMLSDDTQSTTYCGTGYYLAPEFFERDPQDIKYDKSIDLFALGLIIWSILHRQPQKGLEPPRVGEKSIGESWWKKNRLGEDWAPFKAQLADGLWGILVVHMTGFRPKDRLSISFAKDLLNFNKQREEDLTKEHEKLKVQYDQKMNECDKVKKDLDVLKVEKRKIQRENYQQKAEYEAHLDERMNQVKKLTENLKLTHEAYAAVKKDLDMAMIEKKNTQRENTQLKYKYRTDLDEKMKHIETLNKLNHEAYAAMKKDLDMVMTEKKNTQRENTQLKYKYKTDLDEKMKHIETLNKELQLKDNYIHSLTLVVPIKLVFATPEIRKVAEIEASGNPYIGFGNGCVMVESGNELVKWSVDSYPKPHFKKVWSTKRPRNVHVGSLKYILDNGCIVIKYYKERVTHVYSRDLSRKIGQHKGDLGVLCGAIGDKVVYCKEDTPGKYNLHLYNLYSIKQDWFSASNKEESVSTLPISHKWDFGISMCGHQAGCIAVFDDSAKTLDIYRSSYQHVRSVPLPVDPPSLNAVTSVGDIIVIAGSHDLVFYNWVGARLGEITRQQLGITESWIYGIGSAGERLLIAAGGDFGVSKLYVYDVCPNA